MVGDGTNNDTTFYITLTIEQDDDDDDPLERIDSKIFIYKSIKTSQHISLFRPKNQFRKLVYYSFFIIPDL